MAFTVTRVKQSTFGDEKVWQGTVVADDATGVVSCGLAVIYGAFFTGTNTSSAPVVKFNANASAVAANGTLGLSNISNGNAYNVIIYGR